MLKSIRWFSNGKLLVVNYSNDLQNAAFHGTEEECEKHIEMLREFAAEKNLKMKLCGEL